MKTEDQIIDEVTTQEYEHGFVTDIDMEILPPGLNEEVIAFISAKKEEQEWMLEWRLKGYEAFKKSKMPTWQNFEAPVVDFQYSAYNGATKDMPKNENVDEEEQQAVRA